MECQHFRQTLKERNWFNLTTAERAAMLKHHKTCEACNDFVQKDAIGKTLSIVDVNKLRKTTEKDNADPEFIETLKETGEHIADVFPSWDDPNSSYATYKLCPYCGHNAFCHAWSESHNAICASCNKPFIVYTDDNGRLKGRKAEEDER